ncbi:hypothetical protein M422DRAFT_254045 [Sphaerobolus stellatus SS14]|uniref:Uncharacterized protein n=1 Tax=Sphaerobolus stellatus (strain SS14) TaxID=990650 RepID=A0A0C9VLI1_SPHS4|nr:hypothetical protein M422DRAFT_254045 [Sphaerobolus stellatus SS14]
MSSADEQCQPLHLVHLDKPPQEAPPSTISTTLKAWLTVFSTHDRRMHGVRTTHTSPSSKPYEVSLVLAVAVKKLVGNMIVKIKKPPSNRIWYTFITMPQTNISIEPVVSDRQIRWRMVLSIIESKLKEIPCSADTRIVVLPYMDNIPFFDTIAYDLRGSIFAEAFACPTTTTTTITTTITTTTSVTTITVTPEKNTVVKDRTTAGVDDGLNLPGGFGGSTSDADSDENGTLLGKGDAENLRKGRTWFWMGGQGDDEANTSMDTTTTTQDDFAAAATKSTDVIINVNINTGDSTTAPAVGSISRSASISTDTLAILPRTQPRRQITRCNVIHYHLQHNIHIFGPASTPFALPIRISPLFTTYNASHNTHLYNNNHIHISILLRRPIPFLSPPHHLPHPPQHPRKPPLLHSSQPSDRVPPSSRKLCATWSEC